MKLLTVAQLQTQVSDQKENNLSPLDGLFRRAKDAGADVICLPEMFSCPYETKNFPVYAEPCGGPSWQTLSDLAKKHQVYLSAGSVPESDEAGNIYNTAYVFDREGRQLAKHRKVHLFDIDVKGGQRFK